MADMEAGGLGKIRYVGGWAIRKSMDSSRSFIGNKSSDSTEVLSKVSRAIKKVNLLENNIIIPFLTLEQTTTRPETLDAIEVWQFCERGLLHISDSAYVFFLQLEQERVNKINIRRLTSLQTDMIDTSMKEVSNNKHLKDEFTKLFDLETNEDQVIIIVCIIKDICMFKRKPKFLLSDRPKFTVIN